MAEGRLTDALYEERLAGVESATTFGDLDALVADVPFEPADDAEAARTRPRWRRITALSVVGVVTAGAACAGALLVRGVNPFAGPAASQSASVGDDSMDDGDPGGPWEPPPIAEELDAVVPMDETTVAAALDRAAEAGLMSIEQIVLDEESTSVIGVDEDDELRSLYLQTTDVGRVSDMGDSSDGVYLDEDSLDVDLDAAIEEARGASDAGPDQDVRSVLIYRGDGSAERAGEEGNLLQVSFSGGPDVTLRAANLTVL
ncbi:DUF1707 SHOCT-like domain-containing protein [Brevibacterium yomogidense]|uniref:DUF1707 domain-containing protein n=1 Tax=Brevibacterium yomogidense TaxID=946573 RepID=A0A1X6X0P8_9MICO|nr:hypothetical protein FM105_02405 [Brevibacterium yomogidense]